MSIKISTSDRINKAYNEVLLAKEKGKIVHSAYWVNELDPIEKNGDWSGIEKQILTMLDALWVRGFIPKPIHCIIEPTRKGLVNPVTGEINPNNTENLIEGYFVLGTQDHLAK